MTSHDPNENKTKNVRVRTTEENKNKLGVIAETVYRSSMSDAVRTMGDELYHSFFGTIDPDAIAENRIPQEQIEALLAKEIEPSDIDDKYHVGDDDDDCDSPVVVSDGGVARSPSSYKSTLTPTELRKSGPELSWEALRDVVADEDGYWSGDLRLHPDRVSAETMKSNRQKVPRILAAMARHEAGDDGIIMALDLKSLVRDHVTHLLRSRRDDSEGRSWIVNQYFERTVEHLYPHPNPASPIIYTDEEDYLETLNRNLVSFREDAEDIDLLFRADAWRREHSATTAEWREAVSDDAINVAIVFSATMDADVEDLVPLDAVDARADETGDYNDLNHYLARYRKRWVAGFSRLAESERTKILELVDDAVLERLSL